MKLRMEVSDMMDVVKAVESVLLDEDSKDMVMHFGEGKWLVKSQAVNNTMAAGIKVNESAMSDYDPRGVDKLGIKAGELKSFLSGASGEFEMEYDEDVNKLYYRDGKAELETAILNPDAIGTEADSFPQADLPIKIMGETDDIFSDLSRMSNIVSHPSVTFEARDNHLYTHMSGDSSNMVSATSWEDFDDYSIDWSHEEILQTDPNISICIFGHEYLTNLHQPHDDVIIEMGTHTIMLLKYTENDGIAITYFLAPRIPDSDPRSSVLNKDALAEEDAKLV